MAKVSTYASISVPALTDKIVAEEVSGPSVGVHIADRLGGLISRGFFQARLTTESGVAVSSSDRTAQGTIYLTPIDAGLVRVWDGTRWTVKFLGEISLALTVTSGKPYDLFYNGSALSLSSAYTDDTTRADALATQDGIKCLSSDHTKLFVGTLYASGANVIEDSAAKRHLCNEYNQVLRHLKKSDATSHAYAGNTGRSWNNDATNQIDFVLSSAQTVQYALYGDITPNAIGDPAVFGILDWTSGTGSVDDATVGFLPGLSNRILIGPYATASVPAGRHYVRAVEVDFASQSSTFPQFALRGGVYQ